MRTFDVFPLFSSPVFCCRLGMSASEMFEVLKDEARYPYSPTTESLDLGGNIGSFASECRCVLDHFPRERAAVLDCFFDGLASIFKQTETNFEMTTSWLTKTTAGAHGHYHSHFNSFFSGVLYEKGGDGFAPIEFEFPSPNGPSMLLNDPTEWNVYNSRTWRINPKDDVIVFFPSHTRHRVGPHFAAEPRYSVAFNLFPTGNFGRGDSSLSLSVH